MNFGTPVPLLLGIFLIIGAIALFFLDKLKPGYERDYDKVYAVLFLLSGIFLLAHLTMELLPSFQQLIMVGTITSLMIQNIRLRTPVTNRYGQQAVPDEPLGRDSYRPSRSRPVYGAGAQTSVRAELDRRDIPPDRRYSRPMLNGYEDQASQARPRSTYDQDAYYDKGIPDKGSYDKGEYDRGNYQAPSSYREQPYQDQPYQDSSYRSQPVDDPSTGQNSQGDAYSSDSYYSSGPRSDVRLRRRRPSRPRGDSERYRLNPGDPR
ncbi:Ycf66 family protein [Pseudanabaena sp. FACHB-2040]|uniref:Ycf66 family protein n=1 Tax=Pseudanabaena sp. FACHB-2040 TaxID=2692859 RepID=UPI001685567A|nr:Ycf66 family protein [Pseudanabaena sp. FACHB-2040]